MAQHDPFVGLVIEEQYLLQDLLSRGAARFLYRAEEISTSTAVYVHLIPLQSESPENQKQIENSFFQLAKKVHAVTHPNVADLHDYGIYRGMGFLVYRPVDGSSFRQFLQKNAPLSPALAADFVEQLSESLSGGHEAGVVHGDLCPENIVLVRSFDGSLQTHVLEFGIAQLLGCREEVEPSNVASVMGRPQYMSPEKIQGTPLTVASDVYSLGILAYEMLTGTVPFAPSNGSAEALMEVLMRQASESPPPLRRLNAALSEEVDRAVLQALSKDPAERPKTPQAFSRLLAQSTVGLGESFSLPQPVPKAGGLESIEQDSPPVSSPLTVREERDRKATVALSSRRREEVLGQNRQTPPATVELDRLERGEAPAQRPSPPSFAASVAAPEPVRTQEDVRAWNSGPAQSSSAAPAAPPLPTPELSNDRSEETWPAAESAESSPPAARGSSGTLSSKLLDQLFEDSALDDSDLHFDDSSPVDTDLEADEPFDPLGWAGKETIPLDRYGIGRGAIDRLHTPDGGSEPRAEQIDSSAPEDPYGVDNQQLSELEASLQADEQAGPSIRRRKLLPLLLVPLLGGAVLAAAVALWATTRDTKTVKNQPVPAQSEPFADDSTPGSMVDPSDEIVPSANDDPSPPPTGGEQTGSAATSDNPSPDDSGKDPGQAQSETKPVTPVVEMELPERPIDGRPADEVQPQLPAANQKDSAEPDAPHTVPAVAGRPAKVGIVDLERILLTSVAGKKVMDVYQRQYSGLKNDPDAEQLKQQLRQQNRALVSELLVKIRSIIREYGKDNGFAMIVNQEGDLAKGPYIDESVGDPVGMFTGAKDKIVLDQKIVEAFDREFSGQ